MSALRAGLARIACACALLSFATPAIAQQTLDIRAVVNDDAISAYDLAQRLNFIILTSALRDDAATRRGLARNVLQSLVDEALQLQEAKRLGVTVTKKEIDSAIALLERQNQMTPGSMETFLKSRDVDERTLKRQIESSLAWGNVVRRELLRTVSVTEEEINKTLERIKANADKPRILAAEIFIAVDSPRDEAAARTTAQRIFEQLGRGASFPQMARQFSQSASAIKAGDLGWVQAGELEPELDKALLEIPKGGVSAPIRTSTGFYILLIRDRNEPKSRSGDTLLSLRQVLLPLPPRAAPSEVASQQQLAETIAGSVSGCDDFSGVAKELGAGMSGDLGQVKLGELPAGLRAAVSPLAVGKASQPLVGPEGVRIFMVCERKSPNEAELPSRDEVERRLVMQRLELRARRYLRDLRESAFLEIRA